MKERMSERKREEGANLLVSMYEWEKETDTEWVSEWVSVYSLWITITSLLAVKQKNSTRTKKITNLLFIDRKEG